MAGTETQLFPCGRNELLFGGAEAMLVLMDNDRNQSTRLLSIGILLCFAIQAVNPIMVTICSVGTYHWPIAKNFPVCRVTKRTFVFPMPGNIYILQFSGNTMNAILHMAVKLFSKYSKYTDLKGANGYSLSDDDPFLWKKLRQGFQGIAMKQIYLCLGVPRDDLPVIIGRHTSCLVRAGRLSFACKLITIALLYGLLKPEHIQILNNSDAGAGNPNGGDGPAFGCGTVFHFMVLEVEFRRIVTLIIRHPQHINGIMNRFQEKLYRQNNDGGISDVKMWKLSPEGSRCFMRMWGLYPLAWRQQQPLF